MHRDLKKIAKSMLPSNLNEAQLKPFLDEISDLLREKDVEIDRLGGEVTAKKSESKRVKQELNTKLQENRASRNRLEEFIAKQQALLNATPEAVFSFAPGGKVTQMNRAAERFIGLPFEKMTCVDVKETLSLILSKVSEPDAFLAELRTLEKDRARKLRGYCNMLNGEVYEYHSIPEFLGSLYLGRVWCWRDVTELKASQDILEHHAYHDTLTNLPNRLHLINTLTHAIDIAQKNGSQIAVLFIDLDDFKKINDTEGHDVGDQFLISVSKRIRSKLRDGDTLGRLGGDEFLILLEGLNHEHEIGIAYQRIKEIFDRPLHIDGKQFYISGSIGVSQFPANGKNAKELIRKADMAMYQAKNSGKNTIYYFEPNLEKSAEARVNLEAQLFDAFENDEFYLSYQPKLELSSRAVVGVEALLRWKKRDLSNVPPNHFVRIAEKIGLISKITEFVLRKVCLQLRAWENTALANTPISINISVNDLKTDNFLNTVLKTIKELDVPASLIEFELTESALLEEKEQAAKTIKQLKRWGLEIAIDDYGTSYSCLSNLKHLGINTLKIDKTFTRAIAQKPENAAVAQSIIDIGRNLELKVVAEGIETQEDLEFLKSKLCRFAQGYLFAKALAADELLARTELDEFRKPCLK